VDSWNSFLESAKEQIFFWKGADDDLKEALAASNLQKPALSK